ncbi:patatin-like phospholipase family protein [Rickettsia endosymbiont of Pantilius tunicatus]|uniref:patatin-like phospholipase family protein n=1 Tax=Rickettsia endosymbiont of Pantilius tunicatus TaxID=3066267 RepID=UPI0030E268EA
MTEIENFRKNRNFIKPIIDLKEVQGNQVKYIDDLKEVQEIPVKNIENSKEALIEYVAFSGGGAKGAIYSGVYAALKKADLLDNVKAVAGSSAGAITAAIVAFGTKPERFEEISKTTNLQDLLGQKGFSAGVLQLNKDGKPLYDLLDKTIKDNVGDFLQRPDIKIVKDDEALDKLRERHKRGGKIYFRDLALLRKYDPASYKDLVVTAVEKDAGVLTIFSSLNTPDVEVALACRASASIPLVFEPVEINGKKYVDGGYLDNVPTKYFKDNEPEFDVKEITNDTDEIILAKKQGRTLSMAFGVGMEADANIAIYSAKEFKSPGEIVKFLADVLFKMLVKIGGKFKYTGTLKETNEQLRENALNTVVLDTQGIDTLDFKNAQKYANYLHIKGYCQTMEYANNHGLAKEKDKTLECQKFLLNVYEVYDNKNLNKTFGAKLLEMFIPSKENNDSKWQQGIVENHNDKAKILLSFCNVNALTEENLQPLLTEYVIAAATSHNGTLKDNTNSVKALLHVLNDLSTSNKVKESFIEVFAIDKNKDTRFNKTKTYDENIAKFKFTKEDLESFINKNKSAAIKVQDKYAPRKHRTHG